MPAPSPANSSPKSSAAPTATERAARAFAEQTFGAEPTLPFDAQPANTIHTDQRRLPGAFLIAVNRLHPDPNQPRRTLDEGLLRELADSIRRLGVLQPISVRPDAGIDGYRIISGERRYRAAKAAGLTEVPCWVQTPDELELLLRQIGENWQRSDLHPMDLADSLRALQTRLACTQKKLAELTGKSEAEVSKYLTLHKLNPGVQEQARHDTTGVFGRRLLTTLGRLPDADQPAVLNQVLTQNLTAIDAERVVRERLERQRGEKTRGAPTGTNLRFVTANAIVRLAFRKRHVTSDEVLKALREAGDQVRAERDQPSA